MAWSVTTRREAPRPGAVGAPADIARLILIGLYTGTRKSPMIDAALLPTIGRSYVDLDRGVFQRLALGKQESNKRQPTVPIPPKLLMHMRRWKRLGISNHSVIEWQGNAIKAIAHRSWKAIREAAGFPDVRIQTLRHTAILGIFARVSRWKRSATIAVCRSTSSGRFTSTICRAISTRCLRRLAALVGREQP